MKFELIGSHLCVNTMYSLVKCKEAGLDFVFVDLSASLADLKVFLTLHEHHEIYADRREESGREDYIEKGHIGLPCFRFEDGTVTLDLNEAIHKAREK